MKDTEDIINQLYNDLKEELHLYSEIGVVPIRKLSGVLQTMRDTMSKLKAHVLKYPFASREEEISFFKKAKPRFVAEQLYAIDLCVIQTSRPSYDDALIRAFFEGELRLIQRYLEKYSFLYQYYQLDATEMDALFFVRGAYPKEVLVPCAADGDPEFSTACDHAWARFIAYERLQQWMLDELRDMNAGGQGVGPPGGGNAGRAEDKNVSRVGGAQSLKWTGESINLAELAYGIWLTGQVNNGNAGIAEIMSWLEVCFQVQLGRPFRRWQSISGRKRVAVTKYTDEIKAAILRRVDEELGK